jgi:hypothetical protein
MSNTVSTKNEEFHSFIPGQNVETCLGPGVVSAISLVDSIVYVALPKKPKALYVFKPEQVAKAA